MVAKPDEVKQIATQALTAGVMRVIATVVDPQTAAKKLADDVRELPSKALGRAVELPMRAIGQLAELQGQLAELPKIAAGLPLKLALHAVATGEKVFNLLPGHGASTESPADDEAGPDTKASAKPSGAAAWDAAAPKPDPAEYTPPVAGGHTAQLAKVTRAELKAVPDVPAAKGPAKAVGAARGTKTAKVPAKKVPAKAAEAAKAPAKGVAKAVADAPISEATQDVLAELADTITEIAAPTQTTTTPTPTPTQIPTPTEAPSETVATVTPIHAGRDGHVDAALPSTVEAAVEAAPDGAELRSDELPIAGYGSLSITQIRSRISKLDAVQLVQLRDYERAHADRTPIVTMLETRLKKVTDASATSVDTGSTVSSSAPGETAALIAEAPSNN